MLQLLLLKLLMLDPMTLLLLLLLTPPLLSEDGQTLGQWLYAEECTSVLCLSVCWLTAARAGEEG